MDKPFSWPSLAPALLLVLSISCAPAGGPPPAATAAPPQVAEPKPRPRQTRQEVYRYLPQEADSLGTEARLSAICKAAAGKVYYELKDKGRQNARLAVVSAVPLSDFKRQTEFGRLMAEYLLTDLADRGLDVTELRLGREITILPQTGDFILTRNVGELAIKHPHLDGVVVTTFSNTPEQLIVQGRLVRLKDGLVETSWRYTLPLTRDLLALFGEIEQPYLIAIKGVGPEETAQP